jgi:hypothetical protein
VCTCCGSLGCMFALLGWSRTIALGCLLPEVVGHLLTPSLRVVSTCPGPPAQKPSHTYPIPGILTGWLDRHVKHSAPRGRGSPLKLTPSMVRHSQEVGHPLHHTLQCADLLGQQVGLARPPPCPLPPCVRKPALHHRPLPPSPARTHTVAWALRVPPSPDMMTPQTEFFQCK